MLVDKKGIVGRVQVFLVWAYSMLTFPGVRTVEATPEVTAVARGMALEQILGEFRA